MGRIGYDWYSCFCRLKVGSREIYVLMVLFVDFAIKIIMLEDIFPDFLTDNKCWIFERAHISSVPRAGVKVVA